MGHDTRYQANERSESPHQSLSKRTQCMRRNKATPGAREKFHFLFEESVQEKKTAGEGEIDWWRLSRGSGTYQNQSGMHHASVFSRERQSWRGEEENRVEEEINERWDSSER